MFRPFWFLQLPRFLCAFGPFQLHDPLPGMPKTQQFDSLKIKLAMKVGKSARNLLEISSQQSTPSHQLINLSLHLKYLNWIFAIFCYYLLVDIPHLWGETKKPKRRNVRRMPSLDRIELHTEISSVFLSHVTPNFVASAYICLQVPQIMYNHDESLMLPYVLSQHFL